jgi:hypothetical protein
VVLLEKPQKNTGLGTPWLRREDNIKKDIQ